MIICHNLNNKNNKKTFSFFHRKIITFEILNKRKQSNEFNTPSNVYKVFKQKKFCFCNTKI